MTDLPAYTGAIDLTALLEFVSPGNANTAVNYKITLALLSAFVNQAISATPTIVTATTYASLATDTRILVELAAPATCTITLLASTSYKQPILIKDGFEVFPYCTEDLSVAMRLVDAGCKVVMPWAAPIGSAKGIINRDALKLLRDRLPDITLVVDAGLGAPSHAAAALELGYDAVLLNTAIAKAADPVAMAHAFRLGVEAGRGAYEAGLMEARDFASPSTPVVGTPFWHAVS